MVKTNLPDKLASELSGEDFVIEIKVSNDALRLKVRDGSRNAPHIIDIARNSAVPIESINIAEPSLNDVFLYHTGREIRGEREDNFTSMYKHRRMGR
jgi:ABC-2 type transport system ATP-binding protein